MTTSQNISFNGYQSISPYKLYLDVNSQDIDFNQIIVNKYPDIVYSDTYNILSSFSNLSMFKNIVDKFNFQKYLSGNITLFAPINTSTTDDFKFFHTVIGDPVEDYLKYYLLDYKIEPELLKKHTLKLTTRNRKEIMIADMKIIDDLGENKILDIKATGNGWLYTIERPLRPYIY